MTERLKTYVESVVDPIRAFHARKARFREELLAHLVDLTAECAGDENEAIRRFGEPELVRTELQRSVPRLERVAATELIPDDCFSGRLGLTQRPDEGALHYGFRFASLVAVVQLAIMLAIICISTLSRGESLGSVIYLGRPLYFAVPLVLVSWLSLIPLLAYGVAPGAGWRQVLVRSLGVVAWCSLLMGGFVYVERLAGVMTLNFDQFLKLVAIIGQGTAGMYLAYHVTHSQATRDNHWKRIVTN